MKKVLQILSMAVIALAAVSCGGGEITYSDEPLAVVQLNGKWGFIDTKGNEVVPCKYDEVNKFSEGLSAVELNDRWMYIDKTGKVIIKLNKGTVIANRFSEGFAYILGYEPNREGFINKTGKMVISFTDKDGQSEYHWARAFHDGRAAVTKDLKHEDSWGFIDTTGAEVIPCQFKEVTDFSNGQAFVENDEGYRDQYGNRLSYRGKTIIDVNGKAISQINMKNTGEYSPEGWALHKSYTLSGRIDEVYFVNSNGNKLRSDYYDHERARRYRGVLNYSEFGDAKPFSEGLAAVKTNQWRWGFIDKNGKTVIPPVYFDAGEFHEGLAAVQEVKKCVSDRYHNTFSFCGGKWGFIDKTGKTIIPPAYYDAREFDEGLAVVQQVETYQEKARGFNGRDYYDYYETKTRGGKWGIIDKSGNEVIPCKYKSIRDFSDDFARVENENGLWGIIDKTGREIIPCEYESGNLGYFSNGLCAVCRDGKCGFVDTTGKEVVPCKYDRVDAFE
jgi:hypothetical protein